MGQIPGYTPEKQMWETLLDQEILPLTAAGMDMEVTSLVCAETSSQDNLGQDFFLFDFGQLLQHTVIENVASGYTEHLLPQVDDASVFQNLKYLISDSENTQGQSLVMESGNPSGIHSTVAEEVSVPSPSVTSVNEKQVMELQEQDKDIMELLHLSAEQLSHCEEFHDLNLLLEQVETHEVSETVHVSIKDVSVSTSCGGDSDGTVPNAPSEQIHGSEPPKKKQKRISTSVNENTCEVSSTKNEKSNFPPETTHQKYMEMRRKNNIASQRSRQMRKEKNKTMEVMVTELESENRILKQRAEQLEKQRDALKNTLMALITSRPTKV